MIVVTGMHRSGTSALAQALHQLGAGFGDPADLIAADHWNAKGYFENASAVHINNRMILGLGAQLEHWTASHTTAFARLKTGLISGKWKYLLFPSVPGILARGERLAADMRAFDERFHGVFVKEPRFSLTIASWHRHAQVEGIVYIYRDPTACARSIRRRDKLPLALAYRFWRYHIEGFFGTVPEVPLVLLSYDRLFDPETQGGEIERIRAAARAFMHRAPEPPAIVQFDESLRHHRSTQDTQAPRRIAELAEALAAAYADHGTPRIFDPKAPYAAILQR